MNEQVRQGQDLHLRCIASGHPEPNYQWLKDDTPIASTSIPMGAGKSDKHVEVTTVSKHYALHDQGRELVVFATKPVDAGVYTCIAVNTVGRDKHNMNVAVIGKYFRLCALLGTRAAADIGLLAGEPLILLWRR